MITGGDIKKLTKKFATKIDLARLEMNPSPLQADGVFWFKNKNEFGV